MRQFQTVVLERIKPFNADFATEPYEAGWATEAIFFLTIDDVPSGGTLTGRVQMSVDGIHWVDEGSEVGPVSAIGTSFVRVSHFGGWLRLATQIKGASQPVVATVRLVLKE